MGKVALVLSSDYELFGDGSGNVTSEQITTTRHLLDILEPYGAKLTIMFEYGQYAAYAKYGADHPELHQDNAKITKQLIDAVNAGHDVQLHYHAQWYHARYDAVAQTFQLDLDTVDICSLPYEHIIRVLKEGKDFLETLLQPYREDYECIGFRAGSWAVSDESKLLRALKECGFKVDSSVVPNTKFESEQVNFEYKNSPHQYKLWYVNTTLSKNVYSSEFIELPLFTCKSPIAFLKYLNLKYYVSKKRVKQRYRQKISEKNFSLYQKIQKILTRNYYMADLNTMSSATLISMVKCVIQNNAHTSETVPVMFIAHSKVSYGIDELHRFFSYLQRHHCDQIEFWTLQDVAAHYMQQRPETSEEIHNVKDNSNFADLLPILGQQQYLEIKSPRYGWFINNTHILPYFLDKRAIFTRMVFTTAPIARGTNISREEEQNFMDGVIDYVKHHRLCDFIYKAQSNVVFQSCPKESVCVPWGTYEVNIDKTPDALFDSFNPKSRNAIRKALKEQVRVYTTDNVALVYENIKATLARQASVHYPTKEYLEKLLRLCDNAVFLIATKEEAIQGSLILLYDHERGYAMYAGSIAKPQVGSLDLLHYEAMKFLQKRGVRMYDFVGTRIHIQKHSKQAGIDRFKRKFNPIRQEGIAFRTVIRPEKYYLYLLVSKVYFALKGIRYNDPISQIQSDCPVP